MMTKLTKEQFDARLVALGFTVENGEVLMGAKWGPAREFYREYLNYAREEGVEKPATYDSFLATMIAAGYVVVDSIQTEDGGWDHLLLMPANRVGE